VNLFRRIDRVLTVIERATMLVGAAMLFSIMMISALDVAMRYAMNMPLTWSYDLISVFLMCGVFFFSLSDTLRNNEHVAVDLLHSTMNDRARHAALLLGYVLASIVFCAMTSVAYARLVASYTNDEVLASSVAWPTWIAALFVTLGLGVTSLRILYRTCGHFVSAVTGRSFIALPPLSGAYEVV
jgi:TRAP-type mannitol/chloroaromatic compound transport system permease small subunit